MQYFDASTLSMHWFAAQVWAGRERLAADHLRSRGYDVFLPAYGEARRWSDRIKRVERALFPGYVFCRLHGDVFGKILTAPNVVRIVGDGTRPLPIPEHEIDPIRRACDAGVGAEPCPYPEVGQQVLIAAGPLAGTVGVVLRTKGHHRLILSITLLRRSIALEVEADWLSSSPPQYPVSAAVNRHDAVSPGVQ